MTHKDKYEHLIFSERWFYSISSQCWLSSIGSESVYDRLLGEVNTSLP